MLNECLTRVALVGNPNTGKSSVFNTLTGLRQKTGNYPGVTVEKHIGSFKLTNGKTIEIVDLPGLYNIHPRSYDEYIASEILTTPGHISRPDVVIFVADVANLSRNLILFTQIRDLGFPCVLAVNMADTIAKNGISINISELENKLQSPVVLISSKANTGFDKLKKVLSSPETIKTSTCIPVGRLGLLNENIPDYLSFVNMSRGDLSDSKTSRRKHRDTAIRQQYVNSVLEQCYRKKGNDSLRLKLDLILTHKVFGYIIFFGVMLFIFQSIYNWSSYPMDWIDENFANLAGYFSDTLPEGTLNGLISEGIIPGIGGVVIFVPQIACLFFFLAVLEDVGYMSRVVFLMDSLARKFGISGKSIIPIISGTACSIPSIMATRNIENWKERLLTILVLPFVTCSARLPIYFIIISLIIPDETFLGLSTQGLVLMGLYLLGFAATFLGSFMLSIVVKDTHKTNFIVEIPAYRRPIFRDILITVYNKTKTFVLSAGKVILAISVVLWFLASSGPNQNKKEHLPVEESYIGIMGKAIEPVVRPLGYDWKISIAIITSLAAREVFVGTLATIYNVEEEEEEALKVLMKNDINANTGKPLFNFASGISLLLFYAFSMQCISTFAVVRQETNGLKWPVIQFTAMTLLAYFVSISVYQIIR